MELRQIRYFKTVAELLSFSRAAVKLHVAQSALSRQIQALEESVGARLLERDRMHVTLTGAGRSFYAHAVRVLRLLEASAIEAREIALGLMGELVICTDWRVDPQLIASAVERFRRTHPRVVVRLRHAGHKDQIAMLRSGVVQVGFITRDLIGGDEGFEFMPVPPVFVNVILPRGHRFARRKLVRLADLCGETWVDPGGEDLAAFRAYFLQQCRMSGYTPKSRSAASATGGLFGLVAGGCGIAAAPDYMRPPSDLSLKCVRTDCPAAESGAVWRAGHASSLVEPFLAILRERVASSAAAS